MSIFTWPAPTAARKVESFAIEPSEHMLFAGDIGGRIMVFDLDSFNMVMETQAHVGAVMALAAHPKFPYIAALSTDRTVSVWRYDSTGKLTRIITFSIRDLEPSEEGGQIRPVHSTSQAIGFHDSELRLVTRTGNASVAELGFGEDGKVQVLSCARLHQDLDLICTRYVPGSDNIISGSRGGLLVLSRGGKVINEWKVGEFSIHWPEQVEEDTYLLASDSSFVARFNIRSNRITIGPAFTRDDLEYVTYNRASQRAFVASFDRNIYEVDAVSCDPKGVVWAAPFKCRWIKTLERDPDTMVVQCRQGGLYKVHLPTSKVLSSYKRTPAAWWTAVTAPDQTILLAGETDSMARIKPTYWNPETLTPVLEVSQERILDTCASYVKRMVVDSDGQLVFGCTDGTIWTYSQGQSARQVGNLGSAVRDLTFGRKSTEVFAATEKGNLHRVDLQTMQSEIIFTSPRKDPLPLWAVAYNSSRKWLAVAERYGDLFVLDLEGKVLVQRTECGRCKRLKWSDSDNLLFNFTSELHRLNASTGEHIHLIDNVGNTIEDFIWDPQKRYLVLVCYQCTIALCDFQSGRLLSLVPDQMDYSKGLIWLSEGGETDGYPLDFMTFGRSGNAHLFRVHDEKVIALGAVHLDHQLRPLSENATAGEAVVEGNKLGCSFIGSDIKPTTISGVEVSDGIRPCA